MDFFTEQEAKAKKGKKVRVKIDEPFERNDIKKGMTGKVNDAGPSDTVRGDDPSSDVWSVSVEFVEFDDKSIKSEHDIHKWKYEEAFEEI